MSSWPKSVPPDLQRGLDAVLGYRNRPSAQDVWGQVLEWLENNKVEPPPRFGDATDDKTE